MGIETPADLGGSESSFTSAIIAIEELAKIDPSVSVMCDVHNTLVNTVVRKYGTKEQQEKWLPQLAESKVGRALVAVRSALTLCPLARQLLFVGTCLRLRRVRVTGSGPQGRRLLDTERFQDVDHKLIRG